MIKKILSVLASLALIWRLCLSPAMRIPMKANLKKQVTAFPFLRTAVLP